jgi:hypothetical protein
MTPFLPRSLCCALLLGLSLGISGCYSKATAYHGKFTFAYASGLDVDNFVKPIAPGAKLDVVAFANGTETKLTITGAKSSQPGVLAIDMVRERSVVLKGVEPGVADVEITARDEAGNVLVDRMFLHVAKPTVHGLEHACTASADAAYVKGERVDIFHRLSTADGRPVIGYAYTPVRIDPEAALEAIDQPQGWAAYAYRAKAVNPRITIRSAVDGGVLSARVVDRKDLKEATLDCGDDGCRLLEGESRYVIARVRLGETPLCSQTALTKARSLTPEICSVTANLDGEEGTDSNRDQLAEVTGVKLGICKYEVTLPELAGGKGIRLTGEAKIGRVQFPGEGARAEDPRVLWRSVPPWGLAALWWFLPKVAALAYVLMWNRRRRADSSAT